MNGILGRIQTDIDAGVDVVEKGHAHSAAEAEERARQQAAQEQSFGEDDYPYDDGDNWSGEGE